MRNLLIAVMVIGAGGYFGGKSYVQYKAERDLDSLLGQLRPIADVQYRSVVATLEGELRAEGVTVRLPQFDDAVEIESVGVLTPGFLFLLGFDTSARDFDFPERIGVRVKGLRASVDADFMSVLDDLHREEVAKRELTAADICASTHGLTTAALKRLGYYEMKMDFGSDFRREGDALVVTLNSRIEDMYEFEVILKLAGMADPTQLARGARPLLVSGRLDYIDHSYNGRVIEHCAEQKVSAEDVLAAQLREVQSLARDGGMELDAMIIEPYTEFLRGKRRFTIVAEPPRPVDLTRISLYKPSDVPNLLNLTAESG